jgi:integrase
MTQDQYFDVVGGRGSRQQHQPGEDTGGDQLEHPHKHAADHAGPSPSACYQVRSCEALLEHYVVFTNPTVGVKARQIDPEMVPMTEPEIRAIEQLASTPAQRVAVALAAEHAARTGVIRNLILDDLDMPNRRITLDGHNQRLGELTHRALTAWLDYRRAT